MHRDSSVLSRHYRKSACVHTPGMVVLVAGDWVIDMSYRICYACGNVRPNWMLEYLDRCWICKLKANHGNVSDAFIGYSRYDRLMKWKSKLRR